MNSVDIDKFMPKDKNSETSVTLENINTYIMFFGKDVDIKCYSSSFKDIYEIVRHLTKNGFFINSIEFNLIDELFETSMADIDYSALEKTKKYLDTIHNNTKITIEYEDNVYLPEVSDYVSADYDDYMGMVECIKWFRSLIKESDLSPVEKYAYAYDICKTFYYKSSGDTRVDTFKDNTLHLIVKTGNIVCLGFNRLLDEILFGMDGIKATNFLTYEYVHGEPEAHCRGIVRIDDEFYDIHGIYITDPTFDCVDDNNNSIYGNKYDALSGYRYFLVPIHRYNKYFKYATYPRIFKGKNKGKEKYLTKKKLNSIVSSSKNDRILDEDKLSIDIQPLLTEGMTAKEFFKYLNCERPGFEDLISIIIRVRLSEGYSFEDISDTLVYGLYERDKRRAAVFSFQKESIEETKKKLML